MIALLLACCLSAPPEITVDTDTITMGAIVKFSAGDPRTAVSLGYAPQPGLGRRFFKQELITKLSTAGMPTDDLQLPESVLVKRRAQALDAAAVSSAVRGALERQYPDGAVTINSIDIPSIEVGTGTLEYVATLPEHFDPASAIFVRLDIRGPGFTRNLFVRTMAEIQRPQPVLRSPIASQSPVRPEDVEWKLAPIQNSAPVVSTEAVEGMVAKRDLRAGEVLSESLLYFPIIVHRGDSVTVRATAGTVTISAVMRAKAPGHFGETIAVEHISGVGSTTARVIGPGLLEATQGAK